MATELEERGHEEEGQRGRVGGGGGRGRGEGSGVGVEVGDQTEALGGGEGRRASRHACRVSESVWQLFSRLEKARRAKASHGQQKIDL